MTLADEITAIWNDARPVFADAFHGDSYELMEVARPEVDGSWVEQEPETVETGRCALEESSGYGGDQAGEMVIVGLSPYTAELPIDTIATNDHRLKINGMTYRIDDVKRGGHHRLFVTVALTEVTDG